MAKLFQSGGGLLAARRLWMRATARSASCSSLSASTTRTGSPSARGGGRHGRGVQTEGCAAQGRNDTGAPPAATVRGYRPPPHARPAPDGLLTGPQPDPRAGPVLRETPLGAFTAMNPATPPFIALTAAAPRAGRRRLPLPAWTAWSALAAAGVLAGAALLPRAAHAQVGGNAPRRASFLSSYTRKYQGKVAVPMAAANAYDATYLLMYSFLGIRDGNLNGKAIKESLEAHPPDFALTTPGAADPGCRRNKDNRAVLSVLLVTFPFFALVLCGYLAARRGVLPQPAIPGLNAFVLYFALPCMLYRFGASTPIHQLLDPAVAGVYVLCALVMVGATVALTRNARIGWNDAAFGALVAAFPNTGFMGVPLLVALLGAQSAGPAIVTIVVDMVITSSLCIALSRLDGAGTHGVGVALKSAFRGMATNPMPWSIALGALASALQFKLPGPVDKTIAMLADAASPVALFTIGAVLARSQMNQHEQVPARDYVPVALAKLLVHPLLVWGAGTAAMALGVPLTPFALTVMVLLAALPSASNVSLLAEKFGANNGRVARIILVSTALAFLSFSAAVALLT
eukprot:gene9971-10036_t